MDELLCRKSLLRLDPQGHRLKQRRLYRRLDASGLIEVTDQEILAILNNQEIVKERSLDELRLNGADDLSEVDGYGVP